MLRDRLGVSERRACRLVGQHRSTQRHEPRPGEDDAVLRAELRKSRWSARCGGIGARITGCAIWAGRVNRKRVQQFTREALVMLVARGIDADSVVAGLERLVSERGAPELLRCDHGPEMAATTSIVLIHR